MWVVLDLSRHPPPAGGAERSSHVSHHLGPGPLGEVAFLSLGDFSFFGPGGVGPPQVSGLPGPPFFPVTVIVQSVTSPEVLRMG